MNHGFDRLARFAQTHASLDHMRQNMDMKNMAKEILPEENYVKFMKSYRFTFWFQLLGTLAGFIIPPAVLYLVYRDISYCALGAAFGILWMCIWLPFSLLIPPTRIYRKFAKWFRDEHATMDELNVIFYQER